MTPARWLLAIVSFAAAIGVSLYIVLTSWPTSDHTVTVSLAAHGVLLAIALLELGARGAKVRLSAASLRIPMTFGVALRASAGGDFGAAITPARTGAEPARFLIMTEAGMSSAHIILVIYAELFLEMISLALVAIAMFFTFRSSGAIITGMASLVAMYAAFVLGTGALGFVLARRGINHTPPRWIARFGIHGARWERFRKVLEQLQQGIEGMRDMRVGMAVIALLTSIVHILLRLAILPIIVYSFGVHVPAAPLILWPIALTYGSVVVAVPAGGGFIEVAFKETLGHAIPSTIFGASLIWWRFYTFYLYIILGAIAAGGTVLRALRPDSDDDAGAEESGPDLAVQHDAAR
ncbi:MAG TPA: lysylphosphatidylglycerol synthase transmembrane domain-containing protein [Gemmatimonadaceae bacterium]|nr:lysylphosphatidylglycerol synthase transmembrane domain-containing protein [Gemmatimonadaceae bacterium]